jgi:Predicted phosphatase/phosphohexomutase
MSASAAGPVVAAGPRAVLLDMDGTLVDSEHLWLSAEHDVMDRLGSSWTPQDQAHCLGGPPRTGGGVHGRQGRFPPTGKRRPAPFRRMR